MLFNTGTEDDKKKLAEIAANLSENESKVEKTVKNLRAKKELGLNYADLIAVGMVWYGMGFI